MLVMLAASADPQVQLMLVLLGDWMMRLGLALKCS